MAVEWNEEERRDVEAGVVRYPVSSGCCAALARVVHEVGTRRDESGTRGRQIRPISPARYVVPKHPDVRLWYSHTFVDTHGHSVDALTGANGCKSNDYLDHHWKFPEGLQVNEVDVKAVDPGIQELP